MPDVGRPDRLIDMSDALVATVAVAVLLPPVPVPPFVSFVAPVVAVTVVVPVAVGVPDTGQEMLAPIATVAGGVGVQVPTVTPGGRPVMLQLALIAAPVADALFVHSTVPAYGTPTVAVAGNPDRSGLMSEPFTLNDAVAVLFGRLRSFVAPVVPVSVTVPAVVGVPDTVHVIAAPGLTVVGGVGVQLDVRPAGSPVIAHVAAVAARNGEAAFVHE